MEYRNLGSSGLKVSEIGLGTNQFGGKVDAAGVREIISAAIDSGVNLIDTADVYQKGRSEETIGQAIKGRREQVLVATKVRGATGDGPNDKGNSRYHIVEGAEASLRRLGTDVIDLYQLHFWDDATPIEETMRALDDLVGAGKVRYVGCSNFSGWQMTYANAVAEAIGGDRFVTIQSHYHLMERDLERDVLPACRYFGLGILPYFPLAGGFLVGKYTEGAAAPAGSRGESSEYVQKYMTSGNFAILHRLTEFAGRFGKTLGDLAHAWLLAHPEVSSVISGATRVEHVIANAGASGWTMTQEELEEVNGLLGAAGD
jgi:aryl-alcohol dehydrogenase-like predicted oxidoreductase